MKIFELISYKTCYYYLKDTSQLDLSRHVLCDDMLQEAKEVYKEDDQGYLADMFDENMYGDSEDIIEIKTNKGSIIFHKGDDHEYIKQFLIQNSKIAPCAFFASFRVSDDYMFAYAENGMLKRFMCNSEEGCYLEGEKTNAEIECNLNYTLEDEYSFIEPYVKEDDIVNLADKIIEFDMNEDIEILSINYYKKTNQANDKNIPTQIDNNTIRNIHNNLKLYNDKLAGILLLKSKDSDILYIMSFFNKSDDILYYDIIKFSNKEDLINSISRCLNALSNYEYCENPTHIAAREEVIKAIDNDPNMKQFTITTNIKYPNTISICALNAKTFLPKRIAALFNLKIFKNFKEKDLYKIYDFFVKKSQ